MKAKVQARGPPAGCWISFLGLSFLNRPVEVLEEGTERVSWPMSSPHQV